MSWDGFFEEEGGEDTNHNGSNKSSLSAGHAWPKNDDAHCISDRVREWCEGMPFFYHFSDLASERVVLLRD